MDIIENKPGKLPEMSAGKRLFHTWSPVLYHWLIANGVSILAAGAYAMIYGLSHQNELISASQNEQEMYALVVRMAESLVQYSTQLTGLAAAIGIPLYLWMKHRDSVKEKYYGVVKDKKVSVLYFPFGIIMVTLVSIALNNLILISNISSYSETYTETMEALYGANFPIQMLCLALLSPVAEELVFRGLVFGRMRDYTTVNQAILYSALGFGLYHQNMVQIVYATILGVLFAYIYEKYGTILMPIAAHMFCNFISILCTRYQVYDMMMNNILVIGTVTVGCTTLATALYLLIQKLEVKDTPVNQ